MVVAQLIRPGESASFPYVLDTIFAYESRESHLLRGNTRREEEGTTPGVLRGRLTESEEGEAQRRTKQRRRRLDPKPGVQASGL